MADCICHNEELQNVAKEQKTHSNRRAQHITLSEKKKKKKEEEEGVWLLNVDVCT